MVFWGLTMTTASTGSLIQKSPCVVVAMFAAALLREKLGRWQMADLAATGRLGLLFRLNQTQILWVVVPSVFLFGYVTTWYTALRHAPSTLVTSVLSLGAPVTALLGALATATQWVVKTSVPMTQWSFVTGPILSTLLLVLGSAIFITTMTRPKPSARPVLVRNRRDR